MDWATPFYLLVAVLLVLLNGFFVLAEFALVKVRATRVEELARAGDRRAKVACAMVAHLDAYLSATQLGITVASLGLGWIGEPAFSGVIDALIGLPGWWSPTTSHAASLATAFIIITFLHILIGELAPKSVAIRRPEQSTLAIAFPMRWAYFILWLPIHILNGASNWLLRRMGLEITHGETVHSEQELRMLLADMPATDELSLNRLLVLENILDLGRQKVRDVMLPWARVRHLPRSATRDEVLRSLAEHRYSRWPVLEPASGNAAGYLLAKDPATGEVQRTPGQAEARADFARRAFARAEEVKAKGVSSDQQFDEAQQNLRLADSEVKSAQAMQHQYEQAAARLSELRKRMEAHGVINNGAEATPSFQLPLVSPISGTVVRHESVEGEHVNALEEVYYIVNLEQVWVHASISEFDLAELPATPNAYLRLPALADREFDVLGLGGRLVNIGTQVDAQTRTVPLLYELPNRDGALRAGLFADVHVETKRSAAAVAVPEEALVLDSGRPVIFVMLSGETFQRREVGVGIRDGTWVEIKSGVKPGEWVSTRGAYALQLASAAPASFGQGHTHQETSMINALIRWSLANRLIVVVVSAILLLVGGYVTSTMPVDVFPDLTAPTVTILVEGHGMDPEEMETLVTFPLETAVSGAASVRRVRSATAVGISVIWVEFDWGTDIHRARQTVTERIATISGSLPPQVEPPALAPVSSVMGEILFISLTSDRHDPLELRTAATTTIRRRLLSVAGVSRVTPRRSCRASGA